MAKKTVSEFLTGAEERRRRFAEIGVGKTTAQKRREAAKKASAAKKISKKSASKAKKLRRREGALKPLRKLAGKVQSTKAGAAARKKVLKVGRKLKKLFKRK